MRRDAASRLTAAAVALACAAAAEAQPGPRNDEVPPPPRLEPADDASPAERPQASAPRSSFERPNAVRLAPLPESRPDEIVVVAENEFRLPDLGTRLRAEREAEEALRARIQVSLLTPPQPIDPRYDPALLTVNPEARRVGYIELFRVRFGRGSRE